MAIVVRDAASRSRARATRTSVSASTDDVASSRISTSGPAQSGPQQRHELTLTCRQLVAALADLGGQAVGQRIDPVAHAEFVDHPFDVLGRRVLDGEPNVGADRVVEEERLL